MLVCSNFQYYDESWLWSKSKNFVYRGGAAKMLYRELKLIKISDVSFVEKVFGVHFFDTFRNNDEKLTTQKLLRNF